MSKGVNFDFSEVEKNLETLRKLAALRIYAETQAANLQDYMKRNHPWQNRTFQAEKRLSATVEEIPTGYRIVLAHGVDYGVWLELANEKRYAILEPTVRLRGPEVVQGMRNLLKALSS